ncbi:ATP-binding protein [Hymenobacter sp. BT770]|uniref:ATP-binding protein n=1 Tax=Hymenobacter sp. BT770 TaxID=2886942 RepID=UPI001D11E63F|nr:ATP-binding protein [Hymenobacter sp. BT770]MCC3154594.1 histidine kinase [Hymenobacter sp. BT770]MDO3416648.1 ATP-binding protein [Hymenobacter sp. BT770]
MKHFLLLLSLLLGLPAFAQAPDTAGQRIARLPAEGLLLSHGWRYHTGDDPAWARPDLDDSRWDTLNPTRPRRELPTRLHTGLGWLRLRFQLGDSLRLRALLLQTTGNGAWELYLDGQRLQRQGTLDPDPHRVRVNPHPPEPLELPATGRAGHVLAVRFAPWHHPLLHQSLDEAHAFSARLQGAAQRRKATAELAAAGPVFLALGSVVGLLMLLHLAFFYYNPARRANLYFALYTGALSLGALGVYSTPAVPFSSPVERLAFELLTWLLLVSSGLWAARALYALFGFRSGWLYAGLCVCCGALLAYSAVEVVHHSFQNGAFFGFMMAIVLATAEQLRLTGRALRQRRGGAAIIGVGFAAALLAVLGFIPIVTSETMYSALVSALMYPLMFLPPALAISLFLAREFALDAQLLQVKLGEVETLSAQTLAQEQEKQALLAAQNETLETQVVQRTGELQRSLTELRATQAQLIQKEKMASLGELTAGIAHEIQNPLNFVNNFSEVSTELMAELEEAQAAGDTEEVAALAVDVRQNLGKITEHGRRAAAIVRGMLEHSRTSTGERAPTDVNQLADEYLRLAYQGLRANDKGFQATLQTDLAPGLPLVEAVGADLGRVLLNLFSNAFYAVHQRQQTGEAGYAPTVGVATARANGHVAIRVTDNGTGMPVAVQAKIFQPFFTTKPTGEGTGLGLSLSHDIIAQGHGGTLAVQSQDGQGTTFTICLPVSPV